MNKIPEGVWNPSETPAKSFLHTFSFEPDEQDFFIEIVGIKSGFTYVGVTIGESSKLYSCDVSNFVNFCTKQGIILPRDLKQLDPSTKLLFGEALKQYAIIHGTEIKPNMDPDLIIKDTPKGSELAYIAETMRRSSDYAKLFYAKSLIQ